MSHMRSASLIKAHAVAVIAAAVVSIAHTAAAQTRPAVIRFTGSGAPLGTSADGTLNPLKTYQHLYLQLQHQIFETLVAVDFNKKAIVPALATRWEQPDSRTLIFHLRRGVRFHNGEPFNADAVKFSIDLMCDPRNRFAGRFLLDAISQVTAIDEHTVSIALKYPDAVLLRKLAFIGMMFPPGYYRKVGMDYFTGHPVGTGPFRYYYTDTGADGYRQIHLVANEGYWNLGYPLAHELVYCLIPFDKQMAALNSGAVDMVITQDVTPGNFNILRQEIRTIKQRTLRSSICLLNIDKPGPLSDIRVRKALQHGINRQALIARALQGYGEPLCTVAPPEISDNGTEADVPCPAENVAEARRLLSLAGYENGCELTLLATDTPNTVRVVREIQKQLERLGVSIQASFWGRKKILDAIVYPKLKGDLSPGRFDMWVVTGWPHFFGSGINFYFMFFHPSGMYNFGTHIGQETRLSRLYNLVTHSGSPEMFHKRFTALEHYCLENALLIPLYQAELLYAMRPGLEYNPGLNDLPHRLWRCRLHTAQRTLTGKGEHKQCDAQQ